LKKAQHNLETPSKKRVAVIPDDQNMLEIQQLVDKKVNAAGINS
jgi:hypothetical protein